MDEYVLLAKKAVESCVKEGKTIKAGKDLPKELLENKAGVFVTIEYKNQLKGCIGTYLPTKINIAEEIISNAVAAATKDCRFEPVRKEELPYLSFSVYILSEPEPVKNLKGLDPKRFGIIVKTSPFIYPNENPVFDPDIVSKTGLLLPGLEGIEKAEDQFSIVCQKAGIDPEKEKVFIYRFSAKKHQ